MKIVVYILLVCCLPIAGFTQVKSDIVPTAKRAESIDLARSLLTAKPVEVSESDLTAKNPFSRPAPVVEAAPVEAGVVASTISIGDRERLLSMVEDIAPTGTMKLGDTQYLLFGQKKLKIGDHLPIVFQGTTYELHLTGIERTSFTLRLNKEEITRPIKTAITTKP